MQLHVLTGDDDTAIRGRRQELLQSVEAGMAGVEKIDVAADGGEALVGAVSSPSLFGGRRVVAAEAIDTLSEAWAAKLVEAAAASDTFVVARLSGPLPAKLRKALASVGTVTALAAPRGKAVAGRITDMAKAKGVTLSVPVRALLVERGGDDLDRVATVLAQLAQAGLTKPSAAQVDLLLGSTQAAVAPWAVTDALESGDLQTAVSLAERLEPVAVVAFLCSRATQLARVVESGLGDADAVVAELGLSHRFAAEKLLRLARRVGPGGVAQMWEILANADRAVKFARQPQAVLDIILARLAGVYTQAARSR